MRWIVLFLVLAAIVLAQTNVSEPESCIHLQNRLIQLRRSNDNYWYATTVTSIGLNVFSILYIYALIRVFDATSGLTLEKVSILAGLGFVILIVSITVDMKTPGSDTALDYLSNCNLILAHIEIEKNTNWDHQVQLSVLSAFAVLVIGGFSFAIGIVLKKANSLTVNTIAVLLSTSTTLIIIVFLQGFLIKPE